MKIARFKKAHRTLTFFTTNFNYREPYQILIDATFCQAALKNKINIEEQLKKYFQSQIKLLTTQCIILEAEAIGAPVAGATQIVKKFHVHKCGHEGKPVPVIECIKSMTKNSRYIVASQDRQLQAILRKLPGRCLLYLHTATPVLEAPSVASKKWVQKKIKEEVLPAKIEKKIEQLKEKIGVAQKATGNETNKPKRKGPKNPNPLSCKKSKKPKALQAPAKFEKPSLKGVSEENKPILKKAKRKRIKIPPHVKEALKAQQLSNKE